MAECIFLKEAIGWLKGARGGVKWEAAVLTFRMAIISVVGLVSSRLVLQALGVDDYGTYCAVAGLVWAFAFFNSSVTDTGTRFITYALGTGDRERLRRVFSTALRLHLATALFVIIAAETAGLWYLDNKMSIPAGSRHEAFIVFQLILVSLVTGLMQQPYSALLLAHEKFRLYSYIEMAEAGLNLLLVMLLLNHGSDNLIWYALLLLLVRISVAAIYVTYAAIKYPDSRPSWRIDSGVMRKMVGFSGCGVYGNMCVTAYGQGTPLVLNLFFGVAANAAASMAGTVTGMLSGLATTGIMCVYSPLITKSYAADDIEQTGKHLRNAATFIIYGFGVLMVPAIAMMPELLSLWLETVPDHTVEITCVSLFTALTGSLIGLTNTAIHATGDIRRLSFVNGTFYLLCPALGWLAYSLGAGLLWMFIIELGIMVAILLNGCNILRRQITRLDVGSYIRVIGKSMMIVLIALTIALAARLLFQLL